MENIHSAMGTRFSLGYRFAQTTIQPKRPPPDNATKPVQLPIEAILSEEEYLNFMSDLLRRKS